MFALYRHSSDTVLFKYSAEHSREFGITSRTMRGVVITTLLVLAVLSACFAASAPKAEATIDETSAVEETPEIASEAEFEDSEDDLEERSLEEDDMEEFDESDLDERSVEDEELEDESADQDVDETAEQEVDEEEEADTNEMSTADDETEESSEDDNEAAIEVVKDAHRRWVCYHRKCYRVFTCHYRWYQAYRVCKRYGGNLVSIHNCYQNRIVRAYARRYGNLWIGLNDRRCEGRFRWTDRSRYNFRRWYCREPNNYRNEDCVEMYRNGRWNDLRCCNRRRFMCQRRRRRYCHWHHWHRHHHWG